MKGPNIGLVYKARVYDSDTRHPIHKNRSGRGVYLRTSFGGLRIQQVLINSGDSLDPNIPDTFMSAQAFTTRPRLRDSNYEIADQTVDLS